MPQLDAVVHMGALATALPLLEPLQLPTDVGESARHRSKYHLCPVCGLLLPDFIEHALEVFDGNGNGLGQLNTDMPILTTEQFGVEKALLPLQMLPVIQPNSSTRSRFYSVFQL